MATADFAPADRSVPFSVPHGIEALVRWIAHRRAASAKRADDLIRTETNAGLQEHSAASIPNGLL